MPLLEEYLLPPQMPSSGLGMPLLVHELLPPQMSLSVVVLAQYQDHYNYKTAMSTCWSHPMHSSLVVDLGIDIPAYIHCNHESS